MMFLVVSLLLLQNASSLFRGTQLSFRNLKSTTAKIFVTAALIITPGTFNNEALAVSGGGKDFATKDLKDVDFTGKSEIGKDFTQCDAAGVSFKNAVLSGSRFYRSNLKEADFSVSKIMMLM